MKKLLLLTGLMISTLCYSQYEHKGFIGFSIGTSSPLGDFGSASLENPNRRYASNGVSFSIDGAYMLHRNFGLSANLFSKSWAIDFDGAADGSDYLSTGILLGGIATIPKNKLNFDFKLQLGYAKSTREKLNSGFFSTPSEEPEITGNDFAYSIGVGIRLHLGKNIDTMLNYAYFGTKPTLGEKHESIDYNIIANNFTLGIGYRL